MGRMSDWAIEMDEQIGTALEMGATSTEQVQSFVRTNMRLVDDKYVERQVLEIMGPPEFCRGLSSTRTCV